MESGRYICSTRDELVCASVDATNLKKKSNAGLGLWSPMVGILRGALRLGDCSYPPWNSKRSSPAPHRDTLLFKRLSGPIVHIHLFLEL